MMDNIGQQTNTEAGEIGQGQGTAAGPENNATITSSQSGDEGSLENDGNFQRDSRRQEALSLSGHFGHPSLSRGSQSNPNTQKNYSESLTSSTDSSKKRKLSEDDDLTRIGHEVYIYKNWQLREGYHVYKGIQKQLEGLLVTDLAIKIFHIDEQSDDKSYKWFLSEAKKMGRFDHPNIVRFIQCGKLCDENLGNGFYIAMELCHEMTLADVNAASLRRDQKQNLFLQICDGVEYLHKKKVAHMDLKPANILFSHKTKKAVVSDFGLSKHVDKVVRDGKTYIKKSSSIYRGTEGWISKEVIQHIAGETKSTEQQDNEPDYYKADIFSLGLVGHHVFYGCHPFRKIDQPKLQSYWEVNINEGKSPVIGHQKTQSTELDVSDLFEKMLSHDPLIRPTTEEVLQHWMFWSPTKMLTFLKEIYDHYIGNGVYRRKVKESGTEEVKLAYEVLPDTSDGNTLASELCSGKERILMRMRDIMGDRWKNKIKALGYEKPDKKAENSLFWLVRHIRNQVVHTLGGRENRKYEAVEKWTTLFPKLWPYLYEILESDFTEEDKKEYKCKNKHTEDIGVRALLGSQEE